VGNGGFPDDPLGTYQNEVFCDSLNNGTACIEPAPTASAGSCAAQGLEPGVDYCIGVDESRPDFIYADLFFVSAFPSSSCATQIDASGVCPTESGSGLGCVAIDVDEAPTYAGGGNVSKYAGTFAALLPADARGVYFIDIHPNPGLTLMRTTGNEPLTPINRVPLRVEIRNGACCGVTGEPLRCGDDYLPAECAMLGGGFKPGCLCTGNPHPLVSSLDELCDTCALSPDCNDNNACTNDVCVGGECVGTFCINEPLDEDLASEFCCNPNTGQLTPISDGDPCTEDICNPGTGQVTHEPIPAGGACESLNGCEINATCDQDGNCNGESVVGLSCMNDDDCGLGLCVNGGCACVADAGCCLDDACYTISEALCLAEGGEPLSSCNDLDLDGNAGCDDLCPEDPDKTEPGECGCGVSDVDSDGDTVPDCFDICPGGDDFLDEDNDGVPDECAHPFTIPTVSEWGLAILALILLVMGKLAWRGRRLA